MHSSFRLALTTVAVLSAISPSVVVADEAEKAERIVITGSHIKRLDSETASPVYVIERKDIEASGAMSLSELLQLSPYNGAGGFNEALTTGFTPGTAAFDLRSFGPERTLVLVDGRRSPIYPFGAGGSGAFVDINAIPLFMIKRVEILLDGASALYGSDAVAGVVNIITYDEVDGQHANLRYAGSERGGGELVSGHWLGGVDFESFRLVYGAGVFKREEHLGADSDFANSLVTPAFANLLGGAALDLRNFYSGEGSVYNVDTDTISHTSACPNQNIMDASGFGFNGTVCAYDWAAEQQLMPETTRGAASVGAYWSVGEINFAARYDGVMVDTTSYGSFISSTPTAQQLETINGEQVIYLRRLTDTGAPSIETESVTHRLTLSANGSFGDFDWNSAIYRVDNKVDETLANGWWLSSRVTDFRQAVANGDFDLRNPMDAATIAAYTQSFGHEGSSELNAFEWRMSGPVLDTERGPIWLATGVEARQESFYDRSDAAIINGDVFGYGSSGAEGDRDLAAAYIEVAVPFTDSLEVNLAGRYDQYSDFGDTFNPKIALRFEPIEQLLFRASWGTGFRAPGLHQLFTTLNTGSSGGFPFIQSGNTELGAEESSSLVAGFVVAPNSSFEFSVDAWKVDVENIITNLGATRIATLCIGVANPDPICAGRVLNAGDTFTAPDGTVYTATSTTINDSFLNLAGRDAKGVDVSTLVRVPDVFGGLLKFQLSVTGLLDFSEQPFPGVRYQDRSGQNGNPEFRGKLTITWDGYAVNHALITHYVGEWDVANSAGNAIFSVDPYVQVDYQVGFNLKGEHRVLFGIKNLADEQPPYSTTAWPFVNRTLYPTLGRSAYLEWNKTF